MRQPRLNRRQLLARAGTLAGARPTVSLLAMSPTVFSEGPAAAARTAVLTFDDAVKSHRTIVGPLLKELGFGATFFVTHEWMADREHFMTWEEIAELHQMGFEIGNHSWRHDSSAVPRNGARLDGQLALVEYALGKVGVPRPVSFAYCSNGFGPEAVAKLRAAGYRFARRGMQPELPYGKIQVGPAYDPGRHHPLLIPTTGDAYPGWDLEHFKKVAAQAAAGKIVVLQFHGVPDVAHPWVHTPPERFREYMNHLKAEGFRVIAMRDLAGTVDREHLPEEDPMLKARYPDLPREKLVLPQEMLASRADQAYWLENMRRHHRYSAAEAAAVLGLSEAETARLPYESAPPAAGVRIMPYPGGRPLRIGFRDGQIDPLRGTKASVFLPWDPASYVVVDLPEAIFSNLGLLFLGHTHIPTIWDDQGKVIENIDWSRGFDGDLEHRRALPDGIAVGASIRPAGNGADMELWLKNSTGAALTGLRTQICVLLKEAAGLNAQTNDNKLLRSPVAAARATGRDRYVLTAWEKCGRVWANPPCPCMHSDPVLPGCPPGETVRVHGRLRFYEGKRIDREMSRLTAELGVTP